MAVRSPKSVWLLCLVQPDVWRVRPGSKASPTRRLKLLVDGTVYTDPAVVTKTKMRRSSKIKGIQERGVGER